MFTDGGGMVLSDNVRSSDRILVLSKKDPSKHTTSSIGLVDNRLFTGGNRLHAIQDTNSLWYLKYDSGAIPPSLQQQFTSFTMLIRTLKLYFHKRNIEIKEIQD